MSRAGQLLVVAAVAVAAAGGAWQVTRQRAAARVAGGERLYRLGLSPTGAPVKARVAGDIELDAAMVTCVSCHLRSGYGALEGQIRSPPISGEVLFAPALTTFKGVPVTGAPPRRPAYTVASLGVALRTGVDPAGRQLSVAMPRYVLGDEEVALLAEYLGSLATRTSPGVDEQAIHLATVVSAGVPPQEREALRFALQKYLNNKNAQTQPQVQGGDNRSARMAKTMLAASASADVAFRTLELEVWTLEGPPSSWPAQLEEALERRPVLALLSGLVEGPFAPVAAFADAHRLPVLFPTTELPAVDPAPDSFTAYLSGGALAEGEALARFLGDEAGPVVQLVAEDPLARARAAGFERGRLALGLGPTPRLKPPAAPPEGAAVVAWEAPGDAARLEALAEAAPATPLYASAVALGPARHRLTPRLRESLRLTWPYRPTREERAFTETLRPWLKDAPAGPLDPTRREYLVAASAYAAADLLSSALMDLRGHYHGEALLDVLGMLKDQRLPAFQRLTFGAGQRHASKGVWVVAVDAEGELVPVSEWLTH